MYTFGRSWWWGNGGNGGNLVRSTGFLVLSNLVFCSFTCAFSGFVSGLGIIKLNFYWKVEQFFISYFWFCWSSFPNNCIQGNTCIHLRFIFAHFTLIVSWWIFKTAWANLNVLDYLSFKQNSDWVNLRWSKTVCKCRRE